jgi:hypothetical protein
MSLIPVKINLENDSHCKPPSVEIHVPTEFVFLALVLNCLGLDIFI